MTLRSTLTEALASIRWYLGYAFGNEGLRLGMPDPQTSSTAAAAASRIRGSARGPALMIHGIMPRSGTNYVGSLLGLHPAFAAYPHDIWELPYLQRTGDILRAQRRFMRAFRSGNRTGPRFGSQNASDVAHMAPHDFLPLFGAAVMAYVHEGVPEGRRALLKDPHATHLDRFFDVFPGEHLLIVVRDGRDLTESTTRTWPELRFPMVAKRYQRSARMVLACAERFESRSRPFLLVKYEDAVEDPAAFVRTTCQQFGLDPDTYPYDRLDEVPLVGSSQKPGAVEWTPAPRPADFSPTGRWHSWSAYRRWMFDWIAGEELRRLGY